MLIIITRIIIKQKRKKKSESNREIVKTLISITSIMVMYGLSWLFGIFSVSSAAVVVQWFFLVFNSTQGFCLFIFFCIVNKDGREEWKRLLGVSKKKTKLDTSSSVYHHQQHTKSKPTSSYVMSNRSTMYTRHLPDFKSESGVQREEKKQDLSLPKKLTDETELTIREDDKGLLICNEHIEMESTICKPADTPEESESEPEPECQVPPHVMLKLQEISRNTPAPSVSVKPKKKKRKRRTGAGASPPKPTPAPVPRVSITTDSQVPPHILHRLRANSDALEPPKHRLRANSDAQEPQKHRLRANVAQEHLRVSNSTQELPLDRFRASQDTHEQELTHSYTFSDTADHHSLMSSQDSYWAMGSQPNYNWGGASQISYASQMTETQTYTISEEEDFFHIY